MKIQYTELENNIRLIELNGRLDLNGTFSIEVQFVRYCQGENLRVIVDMEKVSYLSSVGIPMLVNSAKAVTAKGGKFCFVRPADSVKKVFDLVGVQQTIPIFKDVDTAIAEYSNN